MRGNTYYTSIFLVLCIHFCHEWFRLKLKTTTPKTLHKSKNNISAIISWKPDKRRMTYVTYHIHTHTIKKQAQIYSHPPPYISLNRRPYSTMGSIWDRSDWKSTLEVPRVLQCFTCRRYATDFLDSIPSNPYRDTWCRVWVADENVILWTKKQINTYKIQLDEENNKNNIE